MEVPTSIIAQNRDAYYPRICLLEREPLAEGGCYHKTTHRRHNFPFPCPQTACFLPSFLSHKSMAVADDPELRYY